MPAAKPKLPMKPREPRILSKEMSTLVSHLLESGRLNEILTKYVGDKYPGFSTGQYNPTNNSIAVMGDTPNEADVSTAHEIVHALKPDKGRVAKIGNNLADRGAIGHFFTPDPVFPTSWAKGKMTEFPSNLSLMGQLRDAAGQATKRRLTETRSSIPERTTWSGLPRLSEKKPLPWGASEEGSAYYYSDPRVTARPQAERAKEFGMFLRNKGIPMNLVAPVIEKLQVATPRPEIYSGGSLELHELVKKRSKRQ